MNISGIECAFIGRLGKDPELRHSQAGKPWLPLNIAVGEKEDITWVKVAVFRDKATQLGSTLHKGDRVYVEGRISLNTWTDQQGQQRAGLKVAAWKVERLGEIGKNKPTKPRAPADGEQPNQAAPVSGPADYQRPLDAGGGRMPVDDTIPFAPEWR
jgi:single-strand DNA-binding protein